MLHTCLLQATQMKAKKRDLQLLRGLGEAQHQLPCAGLKAIVRETHVAWSRDMSTLRVMVVNKAALRVRFAVGSTSPGSYTAVGGLQRVGHREAACVFIAHTNCC